MHRRKIAVIGLGYVGLPVAVSLARGGFEVTGFDIDASRVEQLRAGKDRTREIDPAELKRPKLTITATESDLKAADFFIVTVPTPIDVANRPDLRALTTATSTVGKALKKGDIVVYESTVYPGATEEVCLPILEEKSGLKGGVDFKVGYSPERINPGDQKHRFETIIKVVAAQDEESLDIIAGVYGSVVSAGIHRAPLIRVAEAAKVIENTQRDLNVAFMNELSSLFRRLDIDTYDVLAAANTKWNFLPFTPGLVGGHCIGVDPYYLTHRAEIARYHPEIILAGRRINDGFSQIVAQECLRLLLNTSAPQKRVNILGMTFKENVPDVRNSKVADLVRTLKASGAHVSVCDPVADAELARHEHGIEIVALKELKPAEAVIYAVAHREFVDDGWATVTKALGGNRGIVLDLKAALDRKTKPAEITLWRP